MHACRKDTVHRRVPGTDGQPAVGPPAKPLDAAGQLCAVRRACVGTEQSERVVEADRGRVEAEAQLEGIGRRVGKDALQAATVVIEVVAIGEDADCRDGWGGHEGLPVKGLWVKRESIP